MAEQSTDGSPAPTSVRPKLLVAIGVLVALAVGAGVFVFAGSDDAAAGEVFVEPLGTAGPDPFTDSVTPATVATLADYAADPDAPPAPDAELLPEGTDPDPIPASSIRALVAAAEDASVPVLVGTDPGLYGGTRDGAACDADQLVAFLAADDAKGQAWADVQGIAPDEIESFVGELTAVRLTGDTLVLNHGFTDGEARPRQAVLQKGEAVMVDATGTPRVKCASGNPLLAPTDPTVLASDDVGGEPWDGFDPSDVGVIVPAEQPVEEFVIVDVETEQVFIRAAGALGVADVEATPAPVPTPTPAAPPPTPVPATPTPMPTPAGVNPFESPDPDLADLPIPDELPPGAGTFAAPREGSWIATNGIGDVVCDGFAIPINETISDPGTIAATDTGFTFSGTESTIIEMMPVDGIVGRYGGTAVTFADGVELVSDLVLQVLTETSMVGTYSGVATIDGITCTVTRALEMTFTG